MIRFSSLAILALFSIVSVQPSAQAQTADYTIRDVTAEYANVSLPEILFGEESILPIVAPTPNPNGPLGNIDINKIIVIGEKVWDFIVNNKPSANVTPLKTSIVPAGITSYTQLQWKKGDVVSKVYRVAFKNVFGGEAGQFDYRITYIFGGSYKGKGKFLGQISVMPLNVNLRTDRSLTFKAELAATLNYGTEEDPLAAGQLILNWTSPTTTRLEIKSAEYMIYGDGEIQDLTHGI